jgi:hypothetical protein
VDVDADQADRPDPIPVAAPVGRLLDHADQAPTIALVAAFRLSISAPCSCRRACRRRRAARAKLLRRAIEIGPVEAAQIRIIRA